MKKLISISFIFLLLSFSINTIPAIAVPRTFTQGIYSVRDSNLLVGVNYTIQNISPNNKSLVIIIDSNQTVQELIRLEPNSPKYELKPLQSDYIVVIIGASNIVFS